MTGPTREALRHRAAGASSHPLHLHGTHSRVAHGTSHQFWARSHQRPHDSIERICLAPSGRGASRLSDSSRAGCFTTKRRTCTLSRSARAHAARPPGQRRRARLRDDARSAAGGSRSDSRRSAEAAARRSFCKPLCNPCSALSWRCSRVGPWADVPRGARRGSAAPNWVARLSRPCAAGLCARADTSGLRRDVARRARRMAWSSLARESLASARTLAAKPVIARSGHSARANLDRRPSFPRRLAQTQRRR